MNELIERVTEQKEYIKIKNILDLDKFLKQIKIEAEIFGKDEIDVPDNTTTLRDKIYLPSCKITIWKRHLILSLGYLGVVAFQQNKKFTEYMNKTYGKNWMYDGFNVRVILISNILEKDFNRIDNNWRLKGSKYDEFLYLENRNKIINEDVITKTEKFGNGIFKDGGVLI